MSSLRRRPLALLATLALAASPAAFASEPHPDLLSRAPCAPAGDGNYDNYVSRQLATWREESAQASKQNLRMRDEAAVRAGLLTRTEYAERHRRGRVQCERLEYRSDGLRVVGYLWRGARRSAVPQPLLVFHRGGFREDSKLRPNTQFGFHRFVQAGYVVVGSQYRGNDGGEGRDEMGGADVRDVLRLIEIARSLPGIDGSRRFALGYSRGGMQALLAATQGAGFRAIATVGAPADLLASVNANPRRSALFAEVIPDFARDPEAALRARSPLLWAERIDAPLLLLAGSADPLVAAHENSLRLAARLAELRKTYELVVYDGDTHGVMINARDRDARILAWFDRFR